ncbi:MAG: redoxin domain-containing protein [Woeseiaceae bacterium]
MIRVKRFKQYVFIIVFITVTMPVLSENVIRSFVSGSFSQILEQRQEKPFVLVLWSLDCPSCYKELEMLGHLNSENTGRNIVLVSTDIEASQSELQAVLEKYKLENIESWVFSGDSDALLRFEIDRSWYGELPRSYFVKTQNNVNAVSGILSENKLIKWMNSL